MAQPQPQTDWLSPEAYLAREREAEEKSEYYDGEMVAMSGASFVHNEIVSNVMFALRSQLGGSGCRVYPSDLRVWNPFNRSYTYPDVIIVCGEPEPADHHLDILLNPTVVIEVLSPSTEQRDRGRKAEQARRLETLQEYVLIAQDAPHVEVYHRYSERQWMLTEADDLQAVLPLQAVGCSLALSDVYDNVTFEPS